MPRRSTPPPATSDFDALCEAVGISEIGYNHLMSPIGAFRTLRDVRLESGMRTKADVRPRLWILWVALASQNSLGWSIAPALTSSSMDNFEIAVFHPGSACSPRLER